VFVRFVDGRLVNSEVVAHGRIISHITCFFCCIPSFLHVKATNNLLLPTPGIALFRNKTTSVACCTLASSRIDVYRLLVLPVMAYSPQNSGSRVLS
jgi:hypothetical protein